MFLNNFPNYSYFAPVLIGSILCHTSDNVISLASTEKDKVVWFSALRHQSMISQTMNTNTQIDDDTPPYLALTKIFVWFSTWHEPRINIRLNGSTSAILE